VRYATNLKVTVNPLASKSVDSIAEDRLDTHPSTQNNFLKKIANESNPVSNVVEISETARAKTLIDESFPERSVLSSRLVYCNVIN
jgi:hypothetical protein